MSTVKFSSIFEFQKKSHIKAGSGLLDGTYPFYTSSITVSKYLDSYLYNKESLIFGTGGKANVHITTSPFSTSTDCLVCNLTEDSKSKFETKYIFYYLYGNINILEKGFKGAGLQHISKEYISDIEIPIKSLELQQQIIAILDQANSLRQKRRQSIDLLDEYIKSVFIEMFGDLIKNKNEWKFTNLESFADIASGVTKGQKYSNTKLVEVPYLRVANVQDGYLDLSEIKTILTTSSNIVKLKLINGDVVMTEGGDFDKLGRGAIWKGAVDNCIHQNHIFRVRFDSNFVNPEFFSGFLLTPFVKIYFLKASKKTTNLATINMTQLKALPVPLIPIELQNKFAEIVSESEILKQKMIEQSKELDNQFQALMQKSFQIN